PEMIIYNADGSRAEICGSALRCCSRLISEQTGKKEIQIRTDAGMLRGLIDDDQNDYVTVQMTTPQMIQRELSVDGFKGDYINVGNPHFVIFTDDLSQKPHLQFGERLSKHDSFEHGANIEFVRIKSVNQIEIVVWERGVGATLACGSGSVASVFSGQDKGLLEDEVLVKLPGGVITIIRKQNIYYLAGKTTIVGEGEFLWRV
ncbi:MAG: diaminopimelate epimerase, partial [Candidatus Cloacimonadaceae bacterium]